jgi:NitT/TauT family transport system permease protein
MKNKILKILLPLLVIIMILIFWQYLGEKNLINTALFPTPSEIFFSMIEESQILSRHITSSLFRLFFSVSIGYILGLFAAILTAHYNFLNFLEDISSFLMSIPGISWAPLFVITIGFGNKTINTVGIITAFFPVFYNVVVGLKSINKNLIFTTELFEYSFYQVLLRVKLPAIMNNLMIALKLSFSRTWRTIIAVEMIAATTYGLGFMIYDARELFNSSIMFAGITISGLLYYLIESILIRKIELFTVIKWGMKMNNE